MKTLLVRSQMLAIFAMLGGGMATAHAQTIPGYVVDSRYNLVMDSHGGCVRSGSWTPGMAIMECDPNIIKAGQTSSQEPGTVLVSMESDTLFAFDSAVISAKGKRDLDQQVIKVMKQHPEIEMVTITGHTDRIGSDAYNKQLTQERADAVRSYIIAQGVSARRMETRGMGSANPVVSCDRVRGEVSGQNKELVDCLRPNRRVEVEIKTQRPTR